MGNQQETRLLIWDPQRLHAQYPETDNDIVQELVKINLSKR